VTTRIFQGSAITREPSLSYSIEAFTTVACLCNASHRFRLGGAHVIAAARIRTGFVFFNEQRWRNSLKSTSKCPSKTREGTTAASDLLWEIDLAGDMAKVNLSSPGKTHPHYRTVLGQNREYCIAPLEVTLVYSE
jgi:hypothetical protein